MIQTSRAKGIPKRVAPRGRWYKPFRVTDRQAPVIAHEIEEAGGQFRQGAEHQPFALDLRAQPAHLVCFGVQFWV